MPSGVLVPSIVTPRAINTECPANSMPSMNIATRSTSSSSRETNCASFSVVASISARDALLLLAPRVSDRFVHRFQAAFVTARGHPERDLPDDSVGHRIAVAQCLDARQACVASVVSSRLRPREGVSTKRSR